MFNPIAQAYRNAMYGDEPAYPTPSGQPLQEERLLPDDPFTTWDYKKKMQEYAQQDRINALRQAARQSAMPMDRTVLPYPLPGEVGMPEQRAVPLPVTPSMAPPVRMPLPMPTVPEIAEQVATVGMLNTPSMLRPCP